jgi:hypothetical protein
MKKPYKTVIKFDAVQGLIDEMDLTTKCRTNEYLIPRCILYNILYRKGCMSLMKIGKLFNKDHATVINGLKKYDAFMLCKDFEFINYKEMIETRIFDFPTIYKEELEKSLIEKVMSCNNYFEMRLLQEELKKTMQVA